MPRIIAKTVSVKTRARGQGISRVGNYSKFVDPFPEMHGTLPEKMVYAKLSYLGIPFLFLNDLTINIPEIGLLKDYQADFIIPSVKVIIEVQGAHWHSMAATIDADAYKFALYQTMGYKPLAWWDYEIFADLDKLIFAEPLLVSLIRSVPLKDQQLAVVKRTKVDTSKGIRTLNAKRAKHLAPVNKRRSIRKAKFAYAR